MVEFKDAQTYFAQSKLLIKARPSTTRISTKYTVPKPKPSDRTRRPPKNTAEGGSSNEAPAAAPAPPKASLTLKTYDPVSGTCLKYRTDKQAEVGRLVAGLGRLARDFAALPEKPEESERTTTTTGAAAAVAVSTEPDATAAGGSSGGGASAVSQGKQTAAGGGQQQQQQSSGGGGGGGGGKKGKKKGKR